mgnify:CR=1 FL=1
MICCANHRPFLCFLGGVHALERDGEGAGRRKAKEKGVKFKE